MSTPILRLELAIAEEAGFAKRSAIRLGKRSDDIFRERAEKLLKVSPTTCLRAFTLDDLFDPKRAARESAWLPLRIDLEAAMLRFDECFVERAGRIEEPSNAELYALTALVERTYASMAKQPRCLFWARCRMIDRHFSRLKLRKRIAAMFDRFAKVTPRRPYSQLMPYSASSDFFNILTSIRRGELDPAVVPWEDYAVLLSKYRRAEKFPGKSPKERKMRPQILSSACTLERGGVKLNGPPAAYFAFLELERDDLLWVMRYNQTFTRFSTWALSLENSDLFKQLASFCAGSIDLVDVVTQQVKGTPRQVELRKARERQSNRRRKLRQSA